MLEIELEVAAWVAGWSAEVAAADIRAGRRRFADGMIAFGTHADIVEGRDAVEAEQWSQIWPAIDDFSFDLDRLRAGDGTRFDRPGRATIVLERPSSGDPWLGTHTHFSLGRGVPSETHGERTAIR